MDRKKLKIKELVLDMLNDSHIQMVNKLEKIINQWDENINSMIIPKSIVIALLEEEKSQYDAKGTSFEKEIKKNIEKIKYC